MEREEMGRSGKGLGGQEESKAPAIGPYVKANLSTA